MRKLLPYEYELIEALGVTEEEYLAFLSVQKEYSDPKAGSILDIRNMPPAAAAPAVAGAAAAGASAAATATTLATVSVVLTVVGIVFQVAAALLAPSPQAPKNQRRNREQRFSPRFGFNSSQELAQYGDPVNLVYCNTDHNPLGAVRIGAALVWSSIEGKGSSQFMQLLLVLGAAAIQRLDYGRTAFGQLPLSQFSGSNVWLYYDKDGLVQYNEKVIGDGKDPSRNNDSSGSENVCRIIDGGVRKDGYSQAFSPSSLTSVGVYDPIPVNVQIQERRTSGRPDWANNGVTIQGGQWKTGNDNRYQKGERFTLVFKEALKRQDKVAQEAAKNLRYQFVQSLDQASTYMLGSAKFRLVNISDNVNLDDNEVKAEFECIEAGRPPSIDYEKEKYKIWDDNDLEEIEDGIEQLKDDATDATITGPGLMERDNPLLYNRVKNVTNLKDYTYTIRYGAALEAGISKNYEPEGGGDSLTGGDIALKLKAFGGENYKFTGSETISWETDLDARKDKNKPLIRTVTIPRGGSIAVTKKILASWLANKPKLDVKELRDEYSDDLERLRQLRDDVSSGALDDKEFREAAKKAANSIRKQIDQLQDYLRQKLDEWNLDKDIVKADSKDVLGKKTELNKRTEKITDVLNEIERLREQKRDIMDDNISKARKEYIEFIRKGATSSFRGPDGNIYAGSIRFLKRRLNELKGRFITDQEGVRLVRRYLNSLIKEKEEALNLAKYVSKNWEDLIAAVDDNFFTKCLVKSDYAAYQTVTACDYVKFAIRCKIFRRISGRQKTYGQKDAPDGYKLSDNGYHGRLAFFTVSYRELGADNYKLIPVIFAVRRSGDQDNFIQLDFKATERAKWEFKLNPVGDITAEIKENGQEAFAFIENSGENARYVLNDGGRMKWKGRLVNTDNDIKKALKERGPLYTNEWDLFSVRSDTQVQFSFDNGPEFHITAVTEQQEESIVGKYEDMSIMALGVYSGKGVQDLRAITAYVIEGKNSYIVNESTGAYSLSSSSTSYAPDIFADTVLDRLNGIGKYAKPDGIDWQSLAKAKRFCKNNGLGTQLFMDGVIADLTSWRQFWVENAPYSLLEFARIGGKETLIPAIPCDNSGRANREINIQALFTTGNILDGSYKEEFIDYGDATQDLIATVIYRETESQDVFPRNASVQVALNDVDASNALRQSFDISQFVTQRKQAILYGKLMCNQRRHMRRGIEFKTFPTDSPISPGAYIYVDIGLNTWDGITSGLIMNDGFLNAPLSTAIADNSYSVLVYRNDKAVRSFNDVIVINGTASSLADYDGYMFILGAVSKRKRVFRVTEVQMDEEGEVTVKAMEHLCEESGGKLLSKVANFSSALFTVR